MYAALWRVLPGTVWAKVLQLSLLAAGVLVVLVLVIFPLAAQLLLVEDSLIGQP
jgi:hypothetical protein